MVSQDREKEAKYKIYNWLKETGFNQFAEAIEKRVIGQSELRPLLFVIYNYLECIVYNRPIKHNILLAGPSGCGKTELYRTLRDYFSAKLELSVTCVDTSTITTAGFKGAEPSSILEPYASGGKAHGFGIIFLDEFDKRLIPQHAGPGGNISNVSLEVQNNFLKIIEGSVVTVDKTKMVNTEKLLFIGMGSLAYVRKKRQNNVKMTAYIGFNREENTKVDEVKDPYHPVVREDITDYGAAVELIARFPYLINFKPLQEEYLESLIEKVRSEVEKTLIHAELIIMQPMIEFLKENCRSEYGVRKVDELIRDKAMTAYREAATIHASELETHTLVITLLTKEEYEISFREQIVEEPDLLEEMQKDEYIYSEWDELIKDGIKDFWRGEFANV